jgi:YD repeat-containing protein
MNEQKSRAMHFVALIGCLPKMQLAQRWHTDYRRAVSVVLKILTIGTLCSATNAADLPVRCADCTHAPILLSTSQNKGASAGPSQFVQDGAQKLRAWAPTQFDDVAISSSPQRNSPIVPLPHGGAVTAVDGANAISFGDPDNSAKQLSAKAGAAPGTTALWLMNGITVLGSADLQIDTAWRVTHVGDLNGDGKTDILWRHDDGRVYAWLMDGITLVSGGQFMSAGSGWSITHVADLNGDGKADILWRHTDGTVAAWIMNGLGATSGATLIPAPNAWSITHTADLNGDGKADILWRHADGTVSTWLMNGLVNTAGATLIPAPNAWSITHIADLNGDGKSDILWRHTDGTVSLWLMNGLINTAGTTLLAAPNAWSVTHTADVNGDGKADILWEHTDGTVAAWFMNGIISTVGGTLQAAGSGWHVTHVGKFNIDAKADILWRYSGVIGAPVIGTNFIYDKNGRLTGVISGTEAAKYNYDPAGNILSVDRVVAPALSVLGFSPSSVEVGSNFVIRGTGFGSFTSGGEVRLNGSLLPVVGISPTQLTVTAPGAPTSGILTVTFAGSSASSTSAISIIAKRQLPSITSFSPTSGPAGTSVAINGNSFNGVKELNSVAFNNKFGTVTAVTVNAGSSSTMTAVVPEGATSGPITVATPDGEATSSSLFTVVPTGYTTAQTSFSTIALNGPSLPVSLADPFTLAVSTFNLAQAQSITLGLTSATIAPASGALNVYVLAPDGSRAGAATVSSAGAALVLPDLFQTGTYSIVIERGTNTSAALTLTLSTDVSQAIGIDQAPVAAVATRPGQRVALTFNSIAGTGLSLVANGFAAGNANSIYRISMISPTGIKTTLNDLGVSVSPYPTVNVSPLPVLTENGQYQLIVTPLTSSTPSLTYELKSDEMGTAIAGLTSSTSVGGQFSGGRAKSYTFTWPGGAKLALEATILSPNVNAFLHDASNAVLGSLAIGNPAVTGNLSTGDQAGSYRMRATTTSSIPSLGPVSMKAGTVDMCPNVTPTLLSPQPTAPYPVIAIDGKINVGLQNCGSVAGFPPTLNIFQATNIDGTGGGVSFFGLGPAINEVLQPGGAANLTVGAQLAMTLGLGLNQTLVNYYPNGLGSKYIMIDIFSNTAVQRRAFGPYCFGRGASFPCS